MSRYLNRGGEVWEKREDGSEHELFAADVIKRLVDLETRIAKFEGASSSKSDWCPCCKQGWDCAEEDQKHRKELTAAKRELAEKNETANVFMAQVKRLQGELKNKRCEFCRELPQSENEKAYLEEFGDKKGDLPTMAEWLLTKQNRPL